MTALTRHLVSLQEHSLRQSRVFYFRLRDKDSIILKEIVDDTLPYSVVLIRILNNTLLEVCPEPKYLSVMFEPLGRVLWDSIIHSLLPVRHPCCSHWLSLSHALEEGLINWLLYHLSLLQTGPVLYSQ